MERLANGSLDYVAILRGMWRRRRRLMALVFLGLAVPPVTVVYYTSEPLYEGKASVLIESSPIEQLPYVREMSGRDSTATYMLVLGSRSLSEEVVEALPKEVFEELLSRPLQTDPTLTVANWVNQLFGRPPTVLSPRQQVLSELRGGRMQFLPASSKEVPFITITGLASTPRVAMDLVNTHIQVLLNRTRSTDRGEVRKVRAFLEQQIRQAKKSMEQAEETLAAFQQQRGRFTLGSQMELDMGKLSQTENALAEAQASRQVIAARVAALRQMQGKEKAEGPLAAVPVETPVTLSTLKAAQDRVAALEAKLAALQERYTDAHPLVQGTRSQISTEQARIARMARELPTAPRETDGSQAIPVTPLDRAEAQRQLGVLELEDAVLRAKLERLRTEAEELRKKFPSLTQEEAQYGNLRRALESTRNLYTVFSEKLLAAQIREQAQPAVIRVIDVASLPHQATQSKTQRSILMVLVLAVGVAFGVAFGIEYWRQPIDTESDVQRATGLAVLGAVGVVAGAREDRKGGQEASHSPLVIHLPSASVPAGIHMELYRAIRATIETERLKAPFRSMLVTSPGPSEGKSSTVVNLAHVFQEFGRRVLMVEADLRHPTLHRTLTVPNTPGLVDFLGGTATFQQVCRTLPSGVTLIPGQVAREDVGSMLASSRVKELLELASAQFDLILVDSAPLLGVPDNLLMVNVLDRVILVVRAGATSQQDLQKSQTILQQANAKILGVVLNQASPRDVPYYHPRFRKYFRAAEDKVAAESPSDSARLS